MDTAAWPTPALVDQVLASYTAWRVTTHAVADTYGGGVSHQPLRTPRAGATDLASLDTSRSRRRARRVDQRTRVTAAGLRLGLRTLSPDGSSADGGLDQRLREEGASSPSSRARLTASARLCTPSLA